MIRESKIPKVGELDPIDRLCIAVIDRGTGRFPSWKAGLLVSNRHSIPSMVIRLESEAFGPIELGGISMVDAEKFGAKLVEWAQTISAEEADYERRMQQRQERRDRSKS